MVDGCAGAELTVTARLLGVPLPAELDPYTLTVPEVDEAPKLTEMLVVPCPDAMVAPVGTDQT